MRLAALLCFAFAAPAGAAAPDPLRLIPDTAELVVKVENPRRLIEAVLDRDIVKKAEELALVREFLDTPAYRKFFELLGYFERELGAKWPDLIDKVAGGGVALGAVPRDGNDTSAVLVLQGPDEAATAKFVEKAAAVFEAELQRNDPKAKPERGTHKGVAVLQLLPGVVSARIDGALVVANKPEALKAVIDQNEANSAKGGKPAKNLLDAAWLTAARKQLPAGPLAWGALNLEHVKSLDGIKDLYARPRDNVVLTLAIAGWLDVIGRSPYVAAGLYRTPEGFDLAVRMPAGRDGAAPDVAIHLAKDPKAPGTLPLLEPKDCLFSHSFYFDLGTLWTDRKDIFPAKVAKDFEEGVKQASRLTLGTSVDEMLTQAGPHFRVVVAQRRKPAENKFEPVTKYPAFAVVLSLKDAKLGKSIRMLLKGAAAGFGGQADFKYFEEEMHGVPAFGWRFPAGGKFPDDTEGVRFNFLPTFAAVGDQFVVSANKELCAS